MKNNNIAVCLLMSLLAGTTATKAMAELYISPVSEDGHNIGDKAFVNNTHQAKQLINTTNAANSALPAKSPVVKQVITQKYSAAALPQADAKFAVKRMESSPSSFLGAPIAMKFGRNIPLYVVMDKIVPKNEGWVVNIDDGLSSTPVSWTGGENWRGILNSISSNGVVKIHVNDSEHAIGVSGTSLMAEKLASKTNKVWKLETNKTLRENLDVWAKKAGWSLKWDEALGIDYPISNGAVLTGEFVGKGGVVDRVVYSLRNQKKPLTAIFYRANNVVLITEAGFKQEGAE